MVDNLFVQPSIMHQYGWCQTLWGEQRSICCSSYTAVVSSHPTCILMHVCSNFTLQTLLRSNEFKESMHTSFPASAMSAQYKPPQQQTENIISQFRPTHHMHTCTLWKLMLYTIIECFLWYITLIRHYQVARYSCPTHTRSCWSGVVINCDKCMQAQWLVQPIRTFPPMSLSSMLLNSR